VVNLLLVIIGLIVLCIGFVIGYKYRDLLEMIKHVQREDEAKPAEVIRTNPNKINNYQSDSPDGYTGSIVVTRKTPQQIEVEENAELDRLVSR
jgi:hypothetical protein